jgi:hypothetical protein
VEDLAQAVVDVEVEQGLDPRQHHVFRREAGHVVRLLGLQALVVLRQPAGRIEEDRLGMDIGLYARCRSADGCGCRSSA